MEAKAIAKQVRISPIKARLVIDLIRGKDVSEAKTILVNYNTKASKMILKVLDSATANAVNNNKLDQNKLYVKHISIDMGQTLKRMVPGSRGSTDKNYHRTSNVNIVVAEK